MKKINFTNKKVHYLFVSVVTVLLITVMVLNVFLMYNMAAKQTEEVSSIYMQNIAARLQETLTRAENSLIRIGANLEEVIEEDSSDTKIQSFLSQCFLRFKGQCHDFGYAAAGTLCDTGQALVQRADGDRAGESLYLTGLPGRFFK